VIPKNQSHNPNIFSFPPIHHLGNRFIASLIALWSTYVNCLVIIIAKDDNNIGAV